MKDNPSLVLTEYALAPEVRAFSTQRGSCSPEEPYDGFNITHYCEDSEEHVRECRQQLCAELALSDDRLILPRQTHGCNSLTIDRAFLSLSEAERIAALEGVDALLTAEPQTCIGISTADCVPVLLYAPDVHAVAAIHAGWRGTVQGIVRKAVEEMNREFGASPAKLRAVVGPSISSDAFEVGDEVYAAFSEAGFSMSQIGLRCPTKGGGEKWHIDLWAANALSLEDAGVELAHIMVAGICTHSNPDAYFSARRLGIRSGRIFSGIMLSPSKSL